MRERKREEASFLAGSIREEGGGGSIRAILVKDDLTIKFPNTIIIVR